MILHCLYVSNYKHVLFYLELVFYKCICVLNLPIKHKQCIINPFIYLSMYYFLKNELDYRDIRRLVHSEYC